MTYTNGYEGRRLSATQMLVLFVLLHKGRQYGLEMVATAKAEFDQTLPIGSLYNSLQYLEKKGLVRVVSNEFVHQKQYDLTDDGLAACENFRMMVSRAFAQVFPKETAA